MRSTAASTFQMVGQIKWFDFRKGYGFVSSLENGDVLLHQKCLRQSGFTHVEEGATIRCEVAKDANVLDVGCGSGVAGRAFFGKVFDRINYVGVDMSSAIETSVLM